LDNGFWDKRDETSALQPAKPNEISASTAICGIRRASGKAAIDNMVTHSDATSTRFE
jgi:hypothetical protein